MKQLLFAALLAGCCADAPPKGTLRGNVSDLAGQPVVGATVVVQSDEGEQGEITDENGNYVIDEIPAERVIVRIYFGNRKVEAYADIDENATAHLDTQISVPLPDETDAISFSGATSFENDYIIDY
jgi:hypothetical protein